jgi:hypothetical protein
MRLIGSSGSPSGAQLRRLAPSADRARQRARRRVAPVRARLLVGGLAALLVASATGGCGASTHKSATTSSGASPTSTIRSSGAVSAASLVAGRAPRPEDLTAPGIQFRTGTLEVTVAGHQVLIPADDWNTIVGTSTVSRRVGVAFGRSFAAPATTRNRFQYLADRMMAFEPKRFEFDAIGSGQADGRYVTIVALVNRTSRIYKLAQLRLTATAAPPPTVIASGTFFPTHRQSVTIAPDEVLFLRLPLPLKHVRPATTRSTNYHFHYGWLFRCDQTGC